MLGNAESQEHAIPAYMDRLLVPIKIRHDALRPLVNSAYKVECPFCPDGVLLVRRDEETCEILETDCCIGCGQPVIYLDIKRLRAKEYLSSLLKKTAENRASLAIGKTKGIILTVTNEPSIEPYSMSDPV